MKMPSQVSSLIIKYRSYHDYDVIKQNGNANNNTFCILKFSSVYDMVNFLSILYVGLRVDYTSCDTILLAEMLKIAEFKTNSDGTAQVEFLSYWL